MSVEFLAAKLFIKELKTSQLIWVAKNQYGKIYTPDLNEPLLSLPVWSNSHNVSEFLKNARLIGPPYQPHAIPLDEFVLTWLSDPQRAIGELQINPDGKSSRVLVMTKEEFQQERLT